MKHQLYLLLGSNMGDGLSNLEQARLHIGRAIGPIVTASSSYLTKAWGLKEQPDFTNQAIKVTTALTPHEVLCQCQSIESDLGRVPHAKWGERLIDIDILFYDAEVINGTELVIPHPHLPQRNFTLIPLVEIAPDLVHPVLHKSLQQILDECPDDLPVARIEL